MDRNEFVTLISNLRDNIDNEEARNGIIDSISEAGNSIFDANDSLNASNGEYIHANERLREANMKLLIKFGSEPKKQEEDTTSKKTEEKLTFDNLFNEKGELK